LAASKTIVDLCFLDFLTKYCSKFKEILLFLLTISTFLVNLSSLNLALLQEERPKLIDSIWQVVSMLLITLKLPGGRLEELFSLKKLLTYCISFSMKEIF
jgi:ABC-type iron transport system FetAB permease component